MAWFVKARGLHHVFLVLDARKTSFLLNEETIRLLCDRRNGIGADGILFAMPSESADFGVRVFDADGAERAGDAALLDRDVKDQVLDGLLVLANTLYRYQFTDDDRFTIETGAGTITARLTLSGQAVSAIALAPAGEERDDAAPYVGAVVELCSGRISTDLLAQLDAISLREARRRE